MVRDFGEPEERRMVLVWVNQFMGFYEKLWFIELKNILEEIKDLTMYDIEETLGKHWADIGKFLP